MVTKPSITDGRWGGRLPLAEDGELTDEQRALAEQLHQLAVPFAERAGFAGTTAEGHLIGPWNGQVHRPRPAAGFNQWVLADQQHSSLSPRIREVVMLAVGVAWQSEWVIYSHVAAARTAGLPESMIDDLLAGRTGEGFSDEESAAHAFADQLARTRSVPEPVYDRALALFGQDGVLDLTQLISIYVATAAQLNAFAVPAPPVAGPDSV